MITIPRTKVSEKEKESLKNFPLLLTRVRTNENKKSKNISIIRVSYYCLPFEYNESHTNIIIYE